MVIAPKVGSCLSDLHAQLGILQAAKGARASSAFDVHLEESKLENYHVSGNPTAKQDGVLTRQTHFGISLNILTHIFFTERAGHPGFGKRST